MRNSRFKVQVIEQDRDSWAVKFCKGVVTVLSLGVAWAMWYLEYQRKRGCGAKLKTTLNNPPVPVVTCRVG